MKETEGEGAVYEYTKELERDPKKRTIATLDLGSREWVVAEKIGVKWSRHTENSGGLYFHPEAVSVQLIDVFHFWRDHSAAGVDAFLKNRYRGYLSADALNVYDHLFKLNDGPTELGCWTHARRHFHEAEGNDRAHAAMAYIRRLYAIEKEARELIAAQDLQGAAADEVFLRRRQDNSLSVLTEFKTWLEAEQPNVLPKSLIGQAIAYTLRHWQALLRYTTDGFLDIDNNVAERALRQIAVGRKNWMFAGSAVGAETAATMFTITSSCHRHGVDAFAYLRDILERLAHEPNPPLEDLRAWLPDRWKPPPKPASR